MEVLSKNQLICLSCGQKERYKNSILRSVEEFRLLFPERKITSEQIHDWCGNIKNSRSIQKILKENFVKVGHAKGNHYEEVK
ncbi:hypothetical protein RFW18_13180 [Metabacillus idriensis]|uniref:hypothetical protein n=1 Tax=Metabacillus idriensis TaxID=324768 RepID=UPI002812C090|nr:hypothetical protein [Metabacillus idriensis]MDR0138702.1 hypothetical protein [Metabacillus idriensis]